MRILKIALLSTLATTACKWTDFDDLETEAWVESTEKPNSNSNDYGVALARSQRTSPDGGTLVVLGAGQALYTELNYKAAGGADLVVGTELKLNTNFGIGNLATQPVLIASPDTDDVALITNSGGNGSIAVLSGTHTMVSSQIFGPTDPDAATYFVGIAKPTAQPLVAAQDGVYGPPANNLQPKCRLVDNAPTPAPIAARGIAGVRITKPDSDDLVVWNGDGKLYIFDGAVFDGCDDPSTPGVDESLTPIPPISTAVDVGFAPTKNATVQVIDGKYVVLAGHLDSGSESRIAVYDVTTEDPLAPGTLQPTIVGAPIDRPGLRSATILDVLGERFLIAGYPLASVDGTSAGEVLAFPLHPTVAPGSTDILGLDPTPAMTLHDAQPESNQTFGRAVAVFPYNGKQILAVSADNEVFVYYQTPLYAETRAR